MIDALVASLVYISESVFRQPLLEIWTISNKTRVRSLALRSSIDYAVGGLLLICTSYQAGVEYDCGFESYVCPERPTEVTKTASHFFVVFTTLIASEPGASLRRMSKFNLESETRMSLYSAPEVEVVKLTAQYSFLADPSGPRGTGDDWELIED